MFLQAIFFIIIIFFFLPAILIPACNLPSLAFRTRYYAYRGFPSGSVVKNPPAMQEPQETQVQSLDQEDPLKEHLATHSSVLA